jgi:hypothetical protein
LSLKDKELKNLLKDGNVKTGWGFPLNQQGTMTDIIME